jgi:hypothetical protein
VVLNQRGRRRISLLDRGVSCLLGGLLGGWLCLSVLAVAQSGDAKPTPAPEENAKKLSFNDTIQPILSENCMHAMVRIREGGKRACGWTAENLRLHLIRMLTRSMSRQLFPANRTKARWSTGSKRRM